MDIIEPKTTEEFEQYYDLRWRILRAPQNQPRGTEKDDREVSSTHVMVCEDGKPIGVGRAQFNSSEEAQMRYMAVETDQQGKGIGRIVLSELEMKIAKQGAKVIVLNARETAIPFYEKNGYRLTEDAQFMIGVIPHRKMRKELN